MTRKKEVILLKIKRIESEQLLFPLHSGEDRKSQKRTAHNHIKSKKVISEPNNNKIQKPLEQKMEHSVDDESFEVIVQLTSNLKKDRKKLQSILGASFQPNHVFTYIDAFSAKLTSKQIKKLSNHQEVKYIEENMTLDINLDTASKWFGTQKARNDFNLTGSGVTIAILDTGVDNNHFDLNENKVIGWKDVINGLTAPYDDQGHGTHVASIAAGTGDANFRYTGVAPKASIVGVKVLDANGSGSMAQIIQGIEWVIANKDNYNIRIGNLSLGSSGTSDGEDALSQAVNAAVDEEITFAVAAGNEGPEKYTIGTPGAAQQAITVGSMADVGEMGYFQNLFSSRGPTSDERRKPDISAPGYRITAAEANSYDNYITFSGTSMATPFIAGTIALILEASPSLSPQQVKNTLLETAEDWGEENKDIDYGAGRLQGYRAIETAGNFRGENPVNPDHIRQSGQLYSTRDQELWQYQIDSLSYPVSVTMIIEDEKDDFDLYVYDPNGTLVGYSYTTEREEKVSFVPRNTGNYLIEIYSYRGSGRYYLDVSGG
jgi:serine protease AprX